MSNVTDFISDLEATGDYAPNVIKAMRAKAGPEHKIGAIYERSEGRLAGNVGSLYVASNRLGKGANGKGGFDMLNLDSGRITKFDPSKFILVAASASELS